MIDDEDYPSLVITKEGDGMFLETVGLAELGKREFSALLEFDEFHCRNCATAHVVRVMSDLVCGIWIFTAKTVEATPPETGLVTTIGGTEFTIDAGDSPDAPLVVHALGLERLLSTPCRERL